MTDVTLVGTSEDGHRLVLASANGEEFTLPIDDQLRHAIRHARAVAGQSRPQPDTAAPRMSPKQIQQRIRSGLNAAELAELTGIPASDLEKFETPVLAERAYITELARGTRIGRDGSAPPLGDLVADRLAGRGVDPTDLEWDAWRDEGEPWQVSVDYQVDSTRTRAQWTFDHTARFVTALDEQSRWLTETELLDVPIPTRHLSSVRDQPDDQVVSLHPSRPPAPHEAERDAAEDESTPTERLVEDLNGRRGTRETLDFDTDGDGDDDDMGAGHSRVADVGFSAQVTTASHPAGSARRRGADAGDPPQDSSSPDTAPGGIKRPSKKGRASVPSWDEIVFGAKHD